MGDGTFVGGGGIITGSVISGYNLIERYNTGVG